MVLTVLHPDPRAPSGQEEHLKIDLVAVHGLNGDPVKTWTNKKTGAYWLRDYLPADVEGARVMTYGYNADVAFGNTVADIMDFAKDLLNSLIDKREREDESRRPIIFIAHSLGGIVVKQALMAAHIDSRFQTIKERTIGIAFFGTPHRGSERVSYGKVLTSVATTIMHRPSSKLLSALQSNSDTLQRLNSDFRFQLVNYQILTFYETKAMSLFTKPVVEKYSVLLEVSGEEQIMVGSDHRQMCKFASKDDDIYDKLVKRICRILAEEVTRRLNSSNFGISEPVNQYNEVPYNVSSVFTGRDDVLQKLRDTCVPHEDQALNMQQRRYVIHGLGGSGKTQICLKFAQDFREKFWGIFFIDSSSASAIEHGFLAIAQKCGVEHSVEGIKRWFSNQNRSWLLIFDNADDPQLDVARFFPVGGRGAIILTTRNPDCRVHATVGATKLDQMALNEAILFLFRASFVTDSEDETCQDLAKHIVETLGCLALAIVHAGATIRQRVCTLDDYCIEYSRHRKQLLDRRPIQAGTDYEHTVYSTWEVSIEKITKLSNQATQFAINLLNFFSVLHFEGISEDILEKSWQYFQRFKPSAWEELHATPILNHLNQVCPETWDPQPFREAIGLLSSYSLIHIDGMKNQISLHSLVHTWIRDRLSPNDRSRCYIMSTIILSTFCRMNLYHNELLHQANMLKHMDSCLGFCQSELLVEDDWSKDRISIAYSFGLAYRRNGREKEARDILERTLEYCKKTMNEEYIDSLNSTFYLGKAYFDLGEGQKGIDLVEKALDMARNVLGPEAHTTRQFMRDLAALFLRNNHIQESLDLIKELQIIERKVLKEGDPERAESLVRYADALSESGNHQKALELLEDATRDLTDMGRSTIVRGKHKLAIVYMRSNQWQAAADILQQFLEFVIRYYGPGHKRTLKFRYHLARCYSELDRPQEGIQILTEVVNIARNIYGHDDLYTMEYGKSLNDMEARFDRDMAKESPESSSLGRWTLKRMVERHRRS